jgi:dipeptidyl aminopeptidase/acylaminoacyl peptidase
MKHFRLFGAVVALPAFALAPAWAAEEPKESAARFGARETVSDASLSPSGTKVAFISPLKGQGSALLVGALDGSSLPKPVLVATGDPERFAGCKWASESRLVCSLYGVTRLEDGDLAYFSRQVAVDDDGANQKILIDKGGAGERRGYDLYGGTVIDWLPDQDGLVLMARNFVPESSTGSLLGQGKEGVGVVRTDTRTLSTSSVEAPKKTATEYITDGRGNVRVMGLAKANTETGYTTGTVVYQYRTKGSREWRDLSSVDENGNGFNPYAVDPNLDVAYGLKKLNGRYAAYKMSLDGSKTETLVFAHPEVDVDGFVRIGRRGRVIGVSYATDRRQASYFDPELQKLAASLSKALPGSPIIRFEDSSVDESKLLIWAGSDTNPGRYYLFDRTTKRMGEVMPARPELEKVALAPMKPITYSASDGAVVPGYLTLPQGKESAKGLPAIVMPHGGPGARDEWGFDWLAQYFAGRGYAVLQPNFRGSAGYGDAWFQKNGFQNWRTAINDVDDGGRWLVSQGVDPNKMAVFGWSYGGYAALQSAATEPGLFRAVVAVAPVTDLNLLKEEHRRWTDYNVVQRFVGNGPHVEAGSPVRHAAKIKAPVLLFHGTYDRNVGVSHSRRMASALQDAGAKADLVIYEKLDHYLDDAAARSDMLAKSDAFLRRSLGL